MPDLEVEKGRAQFTLWLVIGGAASLLLPLLGVVYIALNEPKTALPPDSMVMFERRENGQAKVTASQTVAIARPAPVAGSATAPSTSSLDFIKNGVDNTYFRDAAPVASTQTAPAVVVKPASKDAVHKDKKKAFNIPKLQGTKGFSSFKGASPKPTGGQGLTGIAESQDGKGGDMADLLKNVPGGVENPEVKKYLKSQGK